MPANAGARGRIARQRALRRRGRARARMRRARALNMVPAHVFTGLKCGGSATRRLQSRAKRGGPAEPEAVAERQGKSEWCEDAPSAWGSETLRHAAAIATRCWCTCVPALMCRCVFSPRAFRLPKSGQKWHHIERASAERSWRESARRAPFAFAILERRGRPAADAQSRACLSYRRAPGRRVLSLPPCSRRCWTPPRVTWAALQASPCGCGNMRFGNAGSRVRTAALLRRRSPVR